MWSTERKDNLEEQKERVDGDSVPSAQGERGVLEEAYTTGHHPDPKHPLNLPLWRKWAALLAVSWSAFVANYISSCLLPGLPQIAESLGATINQVANAVGIGLLGLAVGPLFFNPISTTIGRRPTMILSTVLTFPCVAWLATATSYNSFAAARAFAGAASAASQTIPPMVIADIFMKSERGDKMSFYAIVNVIPPGLSPVISSYILLNKSWPWMFYVPLIFNGLCLVLLALFLPETQYIANPADPTAGRVGVKYWPWQHPREYLATALRPFVISRYVALTVPATYYGIVFGFSVGATVVAPRLLGAEYGFSTQAVGLSYLAYGIGSILGKTAGGWVGDRMVLWMQARTGERHPEYRIWPMFPLLPILLAGAILFGVGLQNHIHWIGVLIGAGMYYMAFAGMTGLLQTYMVESYLVEPMNAMTIFIFHKCLWGFIVPFFAWEWGSSSSWANAYIAQGFIVFGLGILVGAGLIKYGERVRRAQGMPSTDNM